MNDQKFYFRGTLRYWDSSDLSTTVIGVGYCFYDVVGKAPKPGRGPGLP
jgi:hypothetical protein